ncbi:MAG: LytR C-terminal domain-containing protein [Angustibacter sp.]
MNDDDEDDLWRERRGAHRPQGVGLAGVIPWALAAIAVVVIAMMATQVFGGGDDGGQPSASSKPTQSGSASPSTSVKPRPKPSVTADKTTPITVLNDTGITGLAARAAKSLEEQGWTVESTGNYQGDQPSTAVFYPDSAQKATASALVDDLGGGEVKQSSDFDGITIVLGNDYQPA